VTARIGFVSLGCPKNLVDSEMMLGGLHRAGFHLVADLAEAEVVVVNTCAFLTASQQESIQTILEVARLKETGQLRGLVVTGCLPQRHGESVLEEIPEVDYLLGPGTCNELTTVVKRLLSGESSRGASLGGLDRLTVEWEPRVLSAHRHTAYLKISDGCNNTCSFCVIPQLRGRHRSRTLEDVEAEARQLASLGVKELTLVAQDTTSYGLDLYGTFSLDRLLERLDEVEGIEWVRLLYTYPRFWTESLMGCFGRLHRLVPYVDIPIQHASDAILKQMRRGAGWATTRHWLDRIRSAAPDMVLRTTVITGFPGETEDDFEFLLEMVRDFEFDHLGAFAYSNEEGTPASELPLPVHEEVRLQRRDRLLSQQRGISMRRNRGRIGRSLRVMIDSVDLDRGLFRGRWSGQALEIDGQVIVTAPRDQAINRSEAGSRVRPGDIVTVRIRGAGPYDLIGTFEEDVPL
jgi:ribosomal protein S12 methylthiotransferase